MLNHYQSKNTNQQLNLSRILLIISLLLLILTIIFIFSITAVVTAPKRQVIFSDNSIKSLYESTTIPEEKYYNRYDINKTINNENIDAIISFYTQFTNNTSVTTAIVNNSLDDNVPLNIAFSVAWKESQFRPYAINNSNANGSRDWGLFQLNDQFNKLTREQFFNVNINADKGIGFLNSLIQQVDGDIITALYCYNAGHYRIVIQGIIPESTRNYVIEILEYEDMLNQAFNEWILSIV